MSHAKCKFISTRSHQKVINGEEEEHVEEFLGMVVPNSTADVARRTGLALTAFDRLERPSGKICR